MSNMKKQRAGRLFLRFGLPILILVFFAVWVVKLNDISKTALIDTTGRSFERGVVTQILKDNVSETGTRDGEQVLMVRMTSG
ncbi:MAG TPA: YibE/F family protein, partial [Lachnospiraceae bacterium]|nr:YibE/F family protein [Lachnospiraceae bacterium]